MKPSDKKPAIATVNQVDGVLQDYLDQLLVTATAATREESKPVALAPAEPVQDIALETVAETLLPASSTAHLPAIDWRSSQGVECLIFKVAGLKLAIPLSVLGGVYPVTDKVTPLFGQAEWSLGVWASEELKLTIIDSALLMMPERQVSLAERGYHFFIQLDRSPWALACEEICDTLTLSYDAIKWRRESNKRPWLAGTVIDQMCALIDVPETLQLLEKQRHQSA